MARTYTITLNGTNCTAKQLVSPVEAGASSTVIIQAFSGHCFVEPWQVSYFDYDNGYYTRKTCTLNEDKTEATFEFTGIGSNIVIDATAVEAPKPTDYKIITALTECQVTPLDGFNAGDTVQLEVTANRWFYFGTDTPFVRYTNTEGNEVTHPFELTTNQNGTLTITDADSDITVTGVATKTPNAIFIATDGLHNATCDLPQFLNFGTEYTANVKVDKGYKFDPNAICGISWQTNFGDYTAKYFTKAEDGKSATLTFTTPAQGEVEEYIMSVYGTPVPVVEYDGIYGSINVYVVDDTQLNEFAKQRYVVSTDPQTGVTDYEDMGEFVLRLHRVFVNVGTLTDTVIKAGRYNTGIATKAPLQDVARVEFDSVRVPTPNNDITDYNADVELYLPFVGTIQLDANTVVGRDVSITYVVNIVTGQAAAFVYVDGATIYNGKCKAVSPMLYRTYSDKFGELTNDTTTLQGLTPYILIRYNESRQTQPYNANKRDRIGNFTGRNTFVDIDNLQTDGMYLAEYSDILNRLQQGVVIEPTGTNP